MIDPDLLIRSLLPLPLPELLSVSVPQIFLSEGSWDDPPKVVIPQQTSCNTQGVLSTSQSHSGADTYHQHQQQSQKSFVAQARGQQEHITKQHNEASHAVLPPQLRASQPCTNTIPAAADTSAQPHTSAVQPAAPSIRPQTAQLIFTSRQVDDTDELLDLLLLGRDTPQLSSQTSAAAVRVEASAAQTVHSRAGATTASPHTTRLAAQTSSASEPVSSKDIPQGRTSGQSICVQQVQAPPPAAAAATHRPPMAPKPVSAVIDDELQALLGLDVSSGPAACGSRGQVRGQGGRMSLACSNTH